MKNVFERPVLTQRNFMPYVAKLMSGADQMNLPDPLDSAPRAAFARGTVQFRGELAVHSGATMPLGIESDGEQFDVVMMSDDTGLVAAGIMRSGISPRGGVRAGILINGGRGVTVSTLQELKRATPELAQDVTYNVSSGEFSDSVSFWPGYTGQDVPVYALIDHADGVCGVVVGSVFDEGAWLERILPGEPLESMQELCENLENYFAKEPAGRMMPVAVYRNSELLGYVKSSDHFGKMELYVDDGPRPDTASKSG